MGVCRVLLGWGYCCLHVSLWFAIFVVCSVLDVCVMVVLRLIVLLFNIRYRSGVRYLVFPLCYDLIDCIACVGCLCCFWFVLGFTV